MRRVGGSGRRTESHPERHQAGDGARLSGEATRPESPGEQFPGVVAVERLERYRQRARCGDQADEPVPAGHHDRAAVGSVSVPT